MTEKELLKLFNRVHSNFSSALTTYSIESDLDKLKEATAIFQEFLNIYDTLQKENVDPINLDKLYFIDFNKDRKILKLNKK